MVPRCPCFLRDGPLNGWDGCTKVATMKALGIDTADVQTGKQTMRGQGSVTEWI
jgi:hypothetical protein